MVIFVTGNQGKLSEVRLVLPDVQNINLDLAEIQGSPQEVAIDKCKKAALQLGCACLVEDTSLCFNALNGLPGVYIKHFLEAVGNQGLNDLIQAFPDKSAYALCTFAYSAGPGHTPILFEGRTDGTIVPPQGKKMFGWDPIFKPNGFQVTYAEMDSETKNSISHRGKALAKMSEFLSLNPEML